MCDNVAHINRTLLYIPLSLSLFFLSYFVLFFPWRCLVDEQLQENYSDQAFASAFILLSSLSFIKHYHPDNINLLNPLLVYNCDFLWTNCILTNFSLASSLNFTTSVIVGDMGTTSILKWSRVSHVLKWSCVSHVTLQCRLNLQAIQAIA